MVLAYVINLQRNTMELSIVDTTGTAENVLIIHGVFLQRDSHFQYTCVSQRGVGSTALLYSSADP